MGLMQAKAYHIEEVFKQGCTVFTALTEPTEATQTAIKTTETGAHNQASADHCLVW